MKSSNLPFIFICTLVICLLSLPALATEQSDIDASLKALPLLINKISGDATMAIVYDPADATSKNDAQAIQSIVQAGVQIPGGGKLSTILVGINELGKLSRAKIAFLTPGITSHYDDINTATSAASILTFSTDIDCVKAAKCIIGVVTKPSVIIYYSKPAAEAAKIEFSQNFSMLVKQP